ncbi:purinergic receptor P2Y12 [Silurus asotus]|uniref:Purinergic receptor P2Y12 n=1 Tax=Silurus asotus TaxID=30991 RepID=A0AAD5FSF1_SILAS|nr:purinergic receptor P2Y12 [Silurus asotus]
MELTEELSTTLENFRNLTNSSRQGCSRNNVLKTTVFPILYSFLFLLGLILNGLAVWVFFSIPSRTHFIIYLKNIVVADVLMTLTFPFKILSDSNMASVGLRIFVCRVSSVVFYLTMYISILFFGFISIDRCRKTLNPFVGTSSRRLANRKLLSAAIWVSLLALSLPNMILSSKEPKSDQFSCSSLKTELGLKWHEVVNHICQIIFWGTLVAVVVCYTLITKELFNSFARTRILNTAAQSQQRKKKVRVNVFLVLAVFFICFVPFHFARVPYTLSQTREHRFDCQQKLVFFQVKESTLWLCSLNSLLDPLIYFFLCTAFRDSLFKILRVSPGRCRALQFSSDTPAVSNQMENRPSQI